jgi:hypothetical protein
MQIARRLRWLEKLLQIHYALTCRCSHPAHKPWCHSRALQSQQVRGVSREPFRAFYGAQHRPAETECAKFRELARLR